MKRAVQCYAVISVIAMMLMSCKIRQLDKVQTSMQKELRDIEYELDDVQYNVPIHTRASEVGDVDTDEQIAEEIRLGEMELLAQLVEAEAGNQDLYGKRLVADTVLNRSEMWDMSIEDTIFYPNAFSSIDDGNFDKAAWHISDESFKAARIEYEAQSSEYRADNRVLYFRTGRYSVYGTPAYKYGAHYFSYGD